MNQGDSPEIEARIGGFVALRDQEAWKERWKNNRRRSRK